MSEQALSIHGKPYEGMECLATMEDITEENYCEYQSYPSMTWHPSLYSVDVVQQLLDTQFHQYVKSVQQSDCQAELKRLLAKGPPIWLEDKHALPLGDTDTHICQVWFMKDNVEKSAKLDGAVTGQEREDIWNNLKKFLEVND